MKPALHEITFWKMEYKHNIVSVSAEKVSFHQGLGEVLYKEMLSAPSKTVFQVDDISGQIDTYRDILNRCIRTAKALKARKISPKDTVLVHSHNHIDTVVPVIASYFVGALPCCIDTTLRINDTVTVLEQIRPKIIFTNTTGVAKLTKAVHGISQEIEIIDFEYFREFISDCTADNFEPHAVRDLDEPASISYSSGTCAFPKKLYISHKIILSTSLHFRELSTFSKVVLLCPDNMWISYTETLLFIVLHRGTRIVTPKISNANIRELIAKHQISMLLLAPSLTVQLLNSQGVSSSSLSVLFVCGALCSYSVMNELRQNWPTTTVLPLYGQTEFGGVTLGWNFTKLEDVKLSYERPMSCGRPLFGFSYKIVDPKTEEALSPREIGELRFKSAFQPSNCKTLFEQDEFGFIKTGDLGYYDEEFCFYITDRIKEVFEYKTVGIFPSKLEPILKAHPAVKEGVIIGVPHDLDINHPMALVVRQKTLGDVTESDIIEFFNSKVSDGERLRGGLKFIDKLPLTSTGKISRAQAKRLVLLNQI